MDCKIQNTFWFGFPRTKTNSDVCLNIQELKNICIENYLSWSYVWKGIDSSDIVLSSLSKLLWPMTKQIWEQNNLTCALTAPPINIPQHTHSINGLCLILMGQYVKCTLLR